MQFRGGSVSGSKSNTSLDSGSAKASGFKSVAAFGSSSQKANKLGDQEEKDSLDEVACLEFAHDSEGGKTL